MKTQGAKPKGVVSPSRKRVYGRYVVAGKEFLVTDKAHVGRQYWFSKLQDQKFFSEVLVQNDGTSFVRGSFVLTIGQKSVTLNFTTVGEGDIRIDSNDGWVHPSPQRVIEERVLKKRGR
jgi:hypothetical protein